MATRRREFIVSSDEIVQILDAWNSDEEDDFILDEEDRDFLEDDIDKGIANIVIEDPEKPVSSTNVTERTKTTSKYKKNCEGQLSLENVLYEDVLYARYPYVPERV